jgi:hypothetical protein
MTSLSFLQPSPREKKNQKGAKMHKRTIGEERRGRKKKGRVIAEGVRRGRRRGEEKEKGGEKGGSLQSETIEATKQERREKGRIERKGEGGKEG